MPHSFHACVFAAILLSFGGAAAVDAMAAAPAYNPMSGARATDVAITAMPSEIKFGDVDIDRAASSHRQVVLHNSSGRTLHLSLADRIDPALAVDGGDCIGAEEFAHDQTCTMSVTWSPIQPGPMATSLILHTEAGVFPINLSGTAKGAFAAEPSSAGGAGLVVSNMKMIDFGQGGKGTEAVILSNAGDRAVHVRRVSIAGGSGDLAIGGSCNNADAELAPRQSCLLTVSWDGRESVRSAVVIEHTGTRGVLTISVKGVGGGGGGGDKGDARSAEGSAASPPPSANTGKPGDGERPAAAPAAIARVEMPLDEVRLLSTGATQALLSVGGDTTTRGRDETFDFGADTWKVISVGSECADFHVVRTADRDKPIKLSKPSKADEGSARRLCIDKPNRGDSAGSARSGNDGGQKGASRAANTELLDKMIYGGAR